MKVLFLSVTIGAGHNAVANNVKKTFEDNGHETKLVDMYKQNKRLSAMIAGYGFNAMYVFPRLANSIYNHCKKKNHSLYDNNVKHIKDYILKEINEFEPDIIVSSHIAGLIFTQQYRNEIKNNFKNCFIITDYEVPPSLHNIPENKDIICAPCEVFKNELEDAGFDKNLVFTTGIPINTKFYNKLDKEEIVKNRELKDFDFNKKTILFMGGGKGLGKVKAVVKYLSKFEEIQLLVVCGKNEKLKKQIDKMNKANIYSFGFINFVDELMTLADYLFGKTGGLSATEALAKDLSIISYKNIPCPEYNNLMFLEKQGYAKSVKNPKEVAKVIFSDEENKKNKSFYQKNSAQKIYDIIMKK